MPGVWNVKEKRAPGASVPEFHALASDVDVCATESPLVQVTVPPTGTFRLSGAKARLPRVDAPDGIVTAEDELLFVGAGGVDGDGAAGDDELELPQAMVNARRDETTTIRMANISTSIVFDVARRVAFHGGGDFRNAKAAEADDDQALRLKE